MVTPMHDSFAIPAFGLLVALTWKDRGFVSTFLGSAPLRWLGEISYAVYIVHVFVLMSLSFVWDRSIQRIIPDPMIERVFFIGATYLIVVSAAAFLHFRVDEPVRRRLNELRCASRSKRLGSERPLSPE
jgi:peptidoglycan/LPS O-acetylase OafA/YrhL